MAKKKVTIIDYLPNTLLVVGTFIEVLAQFSRFDLIAFLPTRTPIAVTFFYLLMFTIALYALYKALR